MARPQYERRRVRSQGFVQDIFFLECVGEVEGSINCRCTVVKASSFGMPLCRNVLIIKIFVGSKRNTGQCQWRDLCTLVCSYLGKD